MAQRANMRRHANPARKTAEFDAAASGNIVPAVAGKKIRVHYYELQAQGTVTVNINDGSGGTSLREWKLSDQYGATSAHIPDSEDGIFETSAGNALYATLSAAIQTTIHVVYSEQ